MKKILLIVLAAITVYHLSGEQIGTLTEVLNPEQLVVAGDRCYIMEGPTIFIYLLKDFRLIKKFGKKGEGPGEIAQIPFITNGLTAFDNKILVDGTNKIIIFTRDGTMEKEIRKKGRLSNVLPVGDGFVATTLKAGEDKKAYVTITLIDAQMNASKELYKQLLPQQGRNIRMLPDTVNVAVYENKIYVEESAKGFIIEVFDSKGNALYKIQKKGIPLKVTEKDKEVLLQEFKNDKLVQFQMKQAGGWDEYKRLLDFHYPDNFPPIRDILVIDGKIYVRTYITQKGKEKYHILDLKGKDLKTVFLPKPILASLITRILSRTVRFFHIANEKYYYLVENEEEEEWELHGVPVH
ncbi:MAG: hypothetical protein GTO45_02195 [Candidatus Aminicenantes bacterium]|nr:hypothetical protein [Candidatus Aminicenantes bacterium]NIM77536.1 hypothetical protein [Candidatus Aminicenantes bacterium]NIN16856.1 hypothetical protein [Candidatus Aminicenantes bacterium]NIN40744.1 hypothetical protein [Candidatus Aminicenantes bacterium]NIN83553.1 hypothetical protein [Candidatus Aminicenantes bacterium]